MAKKKIEVESVLCPSDPLLHLAQKEYAHTARGYVVSVSSLTLCLRKWKKREPSRADSQFCPECVATWASERKEGEGVD